MNDSIREASIRIVGGDEAAREFVRRGLADARRSGLAGAWRSGLADARRSGLGAVRRSGLAAPRRGGIGSFGYDETAAALVGATSTAPEVTIASEVTIAIVRERTDWARLNALEGTVIVVAFDRTYCRGDGDEESMPIFHIDDVTAVAEYLESLDRMRFDLAPQTHASEEYIW